MGNVKSAFLLLACSFLLLACKKYDGFTVGCLPNSVRKGVIAFFPFNNGSLKDASPNKNVLINWNNSPMASDRGIGGFCAYEFNVGGNSGQYLFCQNPDFLNGLKDFSISIWYYPQSDSLTPYYQTLIGRGDGTRCPDRNGEWSVGLHDCDRPVFGHNNSVWADMNSGLSCTDLQKSYQGKWHHVVAVKNGNRYKIYFNGKLHERVSGDADCSNLHHAEDKGDLYIGKNFHGRIDDVVIWNRAISGTEVNKLYDLKPCCD